MGAMGVYATQVFPRLMDWAMRSPRFVEYRTVTLAPARGHVLEIGFGTGLNLPHYPKTVASLTVVDPAQLLPRRVAERVAAVPFPVVITHVGAERLPFETARFDCVVSTWTLCTIPDAVAALKEIGRVLKAEGQFLFLEHGRSNDLRVARWQDRLDPVQQVIGCGCHLNRAIDRLIAQAGLRMTQLDRFLLPGVPRIVGEMYQGRVEVP